MANNDFEGARIVLTGGSSGLGRELALLLTSAGGSVLTTARRREKLNSLVEASDGKITALAGDISSPEFRSELVEFAKTELGGVDLLINNAGAGEVDRFEETTPEHFQHLVDLNLTAPVELVRLFLPLLHASKQPHIVNVCSVLSYVGVKSKSAYCAAKFALRGFSDALRNELKPAGVTVTVLNPSTIASEFWESIDSANEENHERGRKAGAKGMSAKQAAAYSFEAIRKRRHEVAFPLSGKLLVLASRWLPGVTRFFADRY